jgi:hypothetical protein
VDSPCGSYVRTARMGFAEKGHGGDTQVVAPHPPGLPVVRSRSAARLPDTREAVIRQRPSFIATAP